MSWIRPHTAHLPLAHLPLATVAVVLSVLLWVAVTNEENPTLRREVPFQVPVQEVNVPRAFVISGLNPEKVSLTLIGPRDAVTNIRPGDIAVQVNLSGAGTSSAPTDGPLRFAAPTEVTVRQRGVRAEVVPASIEVTLEPEIRRIVPIHVSPLDALPVGFELVDAPSVQPPEATIAGAKENVSLVDTVVADVRLGGVTVNINEAASLGPRDGAGHPIGHVKVEPLTATVSLKVRQVLYTRQVLLDARVRGRPAPGYAAGGARAEPAVMNVIGSIDALNQISTLPTQDVDIEGAASEVVRTTGLQFPPGVSPSDPKSSVVVRVPVQPQSGSGAVGAAPRLVGLGPGLTIIGQTAAVVVNVSGPLPALLRLVPSDVVATADVGGLGPGTYRLEPRVALPSGLQLDGVVPERVSVTIISNSAPR